MKWIKRLAIGLGAVVALLLVVALAAPFLVPTSTYKDQIESRVKAATGREIRIAGDLRFSVLPSLTLTAKDVSFANRPGATVPDMARLKELDLELRLGPLLGGKIEVASLVLREPDIVLEVDKNGRPNWLFDHAPSGTPQRSRASDPPKSGDSAQPSRPLEALRSIEIAELRIADGRIRFSDARSGESHDLRKANLTLSMPGTNRPIRANGDVEAGGKRVAFKTEVAAVEDMIAGKPSPFDLEIATELGKAKLSGTLAAGAQMKASSKVTLEAGSVRDLIAWLGIPIKPSPILGKMVLHATVDVSPESVTVAGLNLKLENIVATGDLSAVLAPTPSAKANIAVSSDLGKISFNGTGAVTDKPSVSGRLTIDLPSLRRAAQAFGTQFSPGSQFGPFTLTTTVVASAESVALTNLSAKLDALAATGDLVATLGKVPHLRGTLNIPALDLNPYVATAATPVPPAGPPASTPAPRRDSAPADAATIDASPLRSANADLTLNAKAIRYQRHTIDEAQIGAKLLNGTLTIALTRVALYKGTATGQIVVSAVRGLSVAPNIRVAGVDAQALLAALGATDRLLGTISAEANLSGAGATSEAIINSLGGTTSFRVTNGAVRGYNLGGMVRAITSVRNPLEIVAAVKKATEALNRPDPNQRTEFSELSASFRGAAGVFNTSDLRMAAPLLRVEGKGSVSLPTQRQDMQVLVKAVPTLEGQGGDFAKLGIPIPLKVGGTFDQPSFGLDEKAFMDEVAKKGPEMFLKEGVSNPGELLKRPGSILDQFKRR